MVILHLFIEHHYKYIVSIIRERHVLALHLSTANWRIKLTTGCCCKNAAACYAIYFCLVESIPQLLELWPISMHFHGPSSFTLLYRNATTYGITDVLFLYSFYLIEHEAVSISFTVLFNLWNFNLLIHCIELHTISQVTVHTRYQ